MTDPRLKTLLTVYECGSYTKAAQLLNMTQPAVSAQMRSLEREYDRKFLIRTKNGLILTKEGEVAVRYAKRFSVLEEELRKEIQTEFSKTTLRIGITHTSESNTIAEVLAKYCSAHDNTSITITAGTNNSLYEKLRNYEIDLAIVDEKENVKGLELIPFDTDYLVCVVSVKHPLAKQSEISLEDLKKQPLILRSPDSATRQLFESSIRSVGVSIRDFDILMEVDNISTIKDLVRKDLGVSILPISACKNDLTKNRIAALSIENLSMTREMNIVYTRDFIHTDILQDIIRLYNQNVK